jgi:phage-related protein
METALRATADASAYYDRSLEETSESLMSFLKGNFANDAQLGVSCTETTRNAKAMEMFGQKYNDLTEIQKQQTLLKMVTDAQALSGAMGQASRESDGFENVMGNLKESVKQASAELGAVLLPTVIKLIQGVTGLVQKFANMDDGTKKLIVTIAGIVAGLAPVLIVVGKVISIVGSAITAFGKIKTAITTAITAVKGLGIALPALTSPVGIVIAVIGAVVTAFMLLWNNCDGFRQFWIDLWNNIKEIAGQVVDAIVQFFTGLGESISNIWNSIVEAVSSAWDTICNVVQVAGMFLGQLIQLMFDIITLPFRFIWENCKDTIMEIWDTISTWLSEKLTAISDFFTSVWTAISDFFKGVWDAISSYVSEKVTAIKEKVSAVMEAIKTVFTNIWNAIKEKVSSIMDAIKEKVSAVWDSVKEKVSSVIDGIKSSIESKLNSAKEIVGGILDSIKEKFSSIFDGAKEIVSNAIEFIKGKFNFSWSLPKLKLPHFSISGGFSLNPPSVPKFGIEWYKHGGVMLDPTIFGFNGNKAMVGGEAGAEAIAPIDILLNYIRTAVAEQNASLIQSLKDAIDDLGSKLSDKTEGDIIIPVYIGETMIDDIIVNARKNVTLRSGGLTSV